MHISHAHRRPPSCPKPLVVSLASLRGHDRVSASRLNETPAQTCDVTAKSPPCQWRESSDCELLHPTCAAIQRQSDQKLWRGERWWVEGRRVFHGAGRVWQRKLLTRKGNRDHKKTSAPTQGKIGDDWDSPSPSCRELSLATTAVVRTVTWTVKKISLRCNIEQVIGSLIRQVSRAFTIICTCRLTSIARETKGTRSSISLTPQQGKVCSAF